MGPKQVLRYPAAGRFRLFEHPQEAGGLQIVRLRGNQLDTRASRPSDRLKQERPGFGPLEYLPSVLVRAFGKNAGVGQASVRADAIEFAFVGDCGVVIGRRVGDCAAHSDMFEPPHNGIEVTFAANVVEGDIAGVGKPAEADPYRLDTARLAPSPLARDLARAKDDEKPEGRIKQSVKGNPQRTLAPAHPCVIGIEESGGAKVDDARIDGEVQPDEIV